MKVVNRKFTVNIRLNLIITSLVLVKCYKTEKPSLYFTILSRFFINMMEEPQNKESAEEKMMETMKNSQFEIVTEGRENLEQSGSPISSESARISMDLFPNKTLLELSQAWWNKKVYSDKGQPYLRGCAWSPDGTCCLSIVHTNGMHVTELPHDLYTGQPQCDRPVDPLRPVIHVPEAGLIYDFCWYPSMNSTMPETCCWLTTRQHGPLQLWDAFDGGLRCTYRGFDHVDEMEPALCCTFSPDGTRLYAGYRKCIRIFETDRPGRECTTHPVQAGASCVTTAAKLLAVGSWGTSIGLYSVSETAKSLGRMHGHSGGVTQAKFTPDGQRLVTGARKDHKLLVWDLRYYRKPLNILQRRVDTNQRIYFDISACGRYLVSGATDGILRVWDVVANCWTSQFTGVDGDENPTFQFRLHDDCCNSVSIHPCRPILATGSGRYHASDPLATPQHDQAETTGVCELNREPNFKQRRDSRQSILDNAETMDSRNDQSNMTNEYGESNCENSLVFWWTGCVPDLT